MTIAIAGGGIAGLAGAIALARAGRRVVVFEQAESFAEVGAGVQIGPNGVRALQRLGAWDLLDPRTVEPRRIVVRDALSGRTLNEIALGQAFAGLYGAPYRVAHRGDLLAALVATARKAPGVELRTGVVVTGFDLRLDRVVVHLEPGEAFEAEALIGADGLHSAVRARLHGPAAPDYAGHVLYRALVPIEAVPDSVQTDCVALWLYPGGHVVHYPVSAGRKMNIVVAGESSDIPTGWGAPAAPADVLACLAEAVQPLAAILQAPQQWRQWAAADRPAASRWSEGPVTLIGDAAHPVLPYLAQGAVMALEDAVVLGHCLGAEPRLAEAFRAYERLRGPRVARLSRLSRRQGRIYHLGGPLRLARNAALSAMPPGMFLKQLDWLYSWQAPDVPQ
jgi:2-polyprenyl-6-methoxyphenol hydroxylase-like FAD-dependent oxidoreductase